MSPRILSARSAAEARDIAGRLIPFRAPHHTTSGHGVVGEHRLAAGGVLYLDEVGEFRRVTIERLAGAVRAGGPQPLAIILDWGTGSLEHGRERDAYEERRDTYAATLEDAAAEEVAPDSAGSEREW